LRVPKFTAFCHDLGLSLEPGQRALCAVAYDGEAPEGLGAAIYGGAFAVPAQARGVVAICAGARSGKTRLAALRLLHLALTVPLDQLARGEAAFAAIVAPKLALARQALAFIRGALDALPALKRMVSADNADSLTIRRGAQAVTIEAVAAGRGGAGLRGRWFVGALLDESAFFRDESSGVVNDAALYDAVAPRILRGGQVIVQSTPWARSGLLYDLWRCNWANPTTALAVHAPTRLLRSDPDVLAIVSREEQRDPENALVEYGAQWGAASAGRWLSEEDLARAVRPAIAPARPGDSVAAGGDLGFVRNSAALAVLAGSPGAWRLAHVREWRPAEGKPLAPSVVCRELVADLQEHGCPGVTVDQHYRESLRELAEADALTLSDAPAPAEAWAVVRTLLREGRLQLPDHPLLLNQLRGVCGRLASGGSVQITLPRTPDGRHGDLAAALAGACWAATHTPHALALPAPVVGTLDYEAERLAAQTERLAAKSTADRPWWDTDNNGGDLAWAG
jgi:hypothetical protein